jgi:hypothetical protein
MIRAKGFEDCIVCLYDNNAVVMVKARDVSAADAAKIADIVGRGANLKPESVTVVPRM